MSTFETCRASDLTAQPAEQRWLIEQLWAAGAVGVIGGEPKCCKSYLALQLAVAVASSTPCLGRFVARRKGPVLLFAAEDALHIVRERLEAIAATVGVDFTTLDVHAITAPAVRLDLERDRQRLRETLARLRPKLLVLDPFVRLHRVDENTASDVAPMLAYLRELQRGFDCAVLLVHHARKAGHARAGQALRGSSEIHAWGDSNLYLRRKREQLLLTVEHRAAASINGMELALRNGPAGFVALHIVDDAPVEQPSAPPVRPAIERVEQALARAPQPSTVRVLRSACRMRTATVCKALAELKARGRVTEHDGGYSLR